MITLSSDSKAEIIDYIQHNVNKLSYYNDRFEFRYLKKRYRIISYKPNSYNLIVLSGSGWAFKYDTFYFKERSELMIWLRINIFL